MAREFSRTGSLASLWLQLRTGVAHILRQWRGTTDHDPVAQFLGHYGPDGLGPPDPAGRELALRAQACLACGLCSTACALAGGAPSIDPRDAVLAASRLEVDWRRLGLAAEVASCAGCDACSLVCPAGIPIHHVQAALGELPPRSEP
jgi:ferredoxin